MNKQIIDFLKDEGVEGGLLDEVSGFRDRYPASDNMKERIPEPEYFYFGRKIWELSITALLAGKNLLLSGPKATGKNVLAENLSALFGRPMWTVSFHINTDAAWLVGTDTFDGEKVVFRPGPVWLCASEGGFGVLDEINMAKNESLAVLHAMLDFRRCLDIPGYSRLELKPETRFIATMNHGYAGTRDLNEALTSRFAVLDMPVMPEDDLIRLISSRYHGINEKICVQFAKLYGELEKKAESGEISETALDLRGLLDAIALIAKGASSKDALSMCVINKSFDTYERGLIRDVIDARIPDDLTKAELFPS